MLFSNSKVIIEILFMILGIVNRLLVVDWVMDRRNSC